MQPGDTYTPGTPPPNPPEETKRPTEQLASAPSVSPQEMPQQFAANESQAPATPVTPSPEAATAPVGEAAGWQFTGSAEDIDDYADTPPPPVSSVVEWSASEYVAHQKGAGWFALVLIVVGAVAAVVFLLTRDWASPLAIVLVGIAFAVFGARPPQVLDYKVDSTGFHIGARFYPYTQFRSFSIMQEDAVHSILLMPIQRVGLPITVHYDIADEQEIIGVIGSHLPHEDREVAAIDRFMSKIHF